MTTKVNDKMIDVKINGYLSKLIYAVFADIEFDWERPIIHSPLMYCTYKSLCVDKKDRCDGLKSRFTISDQVRQFITFLFRNIAIEIKDITIVDGDTVKDMLEKLIEVHDDCYTKFMFDLAHRMRCNFGRVLSSAGDPTQWFRGQLVGSLPEYAIKERIISMISAEFNDFLKGLAWLIGKLIWYHEKTIDVGLFAGTLAQQGMTQVMLDNMMVCLREKAPTKPRTKAKAIATTDTLATDTLATDTLATDTLATDTDIDAIIGDIVDDMANLV